MREVVTLNPLSLTPWIKWRRAELIRASMSLDGARALHCHFARRNNALECAYIVASKAESAERRVLLGEAVRDCLFDAKFDQDVLWCEKLSDGHAFALFIDGRVIKDGLVTSSQHLKRELSLILVKLRHEQLSKPVEVRYAGQVAKNALEQALRELEQEVDIDDERRPTLKECPAFEPRLTAEQRQLPRLRVEQDIPAITRVALAWRLTRRAVAAMAVAVVAWGGYQLWPGEPPPPPPPPPDVALQDYSRLLNAPQASQLLADVHHAYRKFVGDPLFGRYGNVYRMRWVGTRIGTRSEEAGAGRALELKVRMPFESLDDRGDPIDLAADFTQYGTGLGWNVRAEGRNEEEGWLDYTVFVPLRQVSQPGGNVDAQPLPEPSAGDRLHERSIRDDFAPMGTVNVSRARRNDVYLSYPMELTLQDAEWSDQALVRWLSERLQGGTVILDAMLLDVTHGGTKVTGTIGIRTIWCSSCG